MSLVEFQTKGGIAGGMYNLIHEKVFDATTTTYNMPANSVDGNSDGGYIIEAHAQNTSGSTATFEITYNSGTRMLYQRGFYEYSDGVPNRNTAAARYPFFRAYAGEVAVMYLHIPVSLASANRSVQHLERFYHGSSDPLTINMWGDIQTSNNFTSFGVTSTITDSIGIGSVFRVYALKG
jgi:hypothetical protein